MICVAKELTRWILELPMQPDITRDGANYVGTDSLQYFPVTF